MVIILYRGGFCNAYFTKISLIFFTIYTARQMCYNKEENFERERKPPMNETIQVLMNRKSVRQFEEKPIPADVKEAILAAAMRAPTAGNSMLYSILDITDQKLKDLLAESCDQQPPWSGCSWPTTAAGCASSPRPGARPPSPA